MTHWETSDTSLRESRAWPIIDSHRSLLELLAWSMAIGMSRTHFRSLWIHEMIIILPECRNSFSDFSPPFRLLFIHRPSLMHNTVETVD